MGEAILLRVSVILTVKNEEATIRTTLDHLSRQTLKPSEIVVSDGGSSDRTCEILREACTEFGNIRFLTLNHATIGTGRNAAIKSATHEILAITDGGCVQHPRWLERIISPFEDPRVDVVGGCYLPRPKSLLDFCIAEIAYPRRDRIDPNKYLPSSRSIALRRGVWQAVGGYPEEYEYGEDTFFDLAIRARGFNVEIAREAVVFWGPPSNLKRLFKQSFHYGKGNGEARVLHFIHLSQIGVYGGGLFLLLLSIGQPLLILIVIAAAGLYLYFRAVRRLEIVRKTTATILASCAVALTIDLAGIAGYVSGLFSRHH